LIRDHLVQNVKKKKGVNKYRYNKNMATEINGKSSVIRADTRGVLKGRHHTEDRVEIT
jgi:hypothetical protein